MKLKKIDWLNHLVSFSSALFGIFIAFQLEDWQDRKSQQEKVSVTLVAIQKEIEGNMNTYSANIELKEFIEYFYFIKSHTKNDKLIATDRELTHFRNQNTERFMNVKFLYSVNDSVNVYTSDIKIDVLPSTSISINNWEAAKSSGVLLNLDHTRMAILTEIYDWTQKEVGMNQFYKNLIKGEQFGNADEMIRNYKIISQESEFKFSQIKKLYEKMNWELN